MYNLIILILFILLILIIIYAYINIFSVDNNKVYERIYPLKRKQKDKISQDYEYIIVGSGPAGLQTAYYLEKYNKKYIVLEKDNCVGGFFKKYPIHRQLISINKVYTGSENKEFNLRHDWNSLLSQDESLLFKNYSKEYFPPADVMVQYLNDFYERYKLNIVFNANVRDISKKGENFIVKTQENEYSGEKVIVAAGLFKINKTNLAPPDSILYSDLSEDKSMFVNKKVGIIGGGNSAFETANYLTDVTSTIQLIVKGPIKFAWQTHYAGDIRAINNNFLDTYQLKSQNVIVEIEEGDRIIKRNGKYFMGYEDGEIDVDSTPEGGLDYIINCSGFNMDTSIFNNCAPIHNGKVPLIKPNFESINIENLFFAGVLGQEIAYKKSSGAFIHGFRYLIRSMIDIDTGHINITVINNKEQLYNIIYDRINHSSGIYQMFGCLVDAIIIIDEKILYIQEIPIKYLETYIIPFVKKAAIISLNYGSNFGGVIENTYTLGDATYVFGQDRAIGADPGYGHHSNFLHPIFNLYINSIHLKDIHLCENLYTEFKTDYYKNEINNFIHYFYNLSSFHIIQESIKQPLLKIYYSKFFKSNLYLDIKDYFI